MGLLSCLVMGSLLWSSTAAKPTPAQPRNHESGGEEHIVIVNKHAPITPQIAHILQQLDLNSSHPDVRHLFNNSAFQGFAALMKTHCLDLLANMSEVSMVEKAVSITRGTVTTYDTRSHSPWGLQRISTASSVSGSETAMDFTYSYATDNALGSDVDIYVLDTGIYTQHNVFGGRAQMLWSFDGGSFEDSDGHGTHVSGTAAGAILGVASNANLYGVKTLDSDGGGWSSNVIAGIDNVIRRHDEQLRSGSTFAGSVISMSLASTEPVPAIDAAVSAAVSAGIHVCVAAGNNGEDACRSSPASSGGSHGDAVTVGAIDMNNQRASFSNHGDCVDVYAPGVDVISSWVGAPNMVNSLSGTSMATPHVTGIVAYAMANRTLARSPTLMKDWIKTMALPLSDGSLLANNGVRDGSPKSIGTEAGFISISKSSWRTSKTRVSIAGTVKNTA